MFRKEPDGLLGMLVVTQAVGSSVFLSGAAALQIFSLRNFAVGLRNLM